jgi:hypothetical protein
LRGANDEAAGGKEFVRGERETARNGLEASRRREGVEGTKTPTLLAVQN